jgi:CRISPR-associated endonuclease/helicase Cas3
MTAIGKTGSGGATRTLIGHSLDVAYATRQMIAAGATRDRFSALVGFELTDVHVDRLAVFAGLHDVGKATCGFQVRVGTIQGVRGGHLAEALAGLRHSKIGRQLGQAMRGEALASWFVNLWAAFEAVIGHHGGPVPMADVETCRATTTTNWSASQRYDPIAEVKALTDILFAAFPNCLGATTPFPDDTRFEHALAGLAMAADWLGSSLPVVGPADRPTDVAATLASLPWTRWHSGASHNAPLGAHIPRAAQLAALTLPLERVAIIEAPTGTGKTEAALVWCSRLVEAKLADGMYFAVPTRSAATELHARISRVMTTAHPHLRGKVVRAVPGDIDTDDSSQTTWAIGSSRKTQAAPIAVGSIDQALLSQIKNRHAWMRSLWLSRLLLVIDEVHASDAYMAELVLRLVDEHTRAGGYVLAMSATLGEVLRAKLEQRPMLPLALAVAQDYPVVSSGPHRMPVAAPTRTVNVQIQHYLSTMASAVRAANTGHAVLWIRSTVTNAIEDWERFRVEGVPTILHHSRYADDDRSWLDGQVLAVIGLEGQRRGVVIVGTQTLEQSLDIDADLLATDACPADVLLQRLGRLYRHRPGTPLAVMIRPENWDAYVGADRHKAFQRWHYVYSPLSVRATVGWVQVRGYIRVPEDVRDLVETATHPDGLAALARAYGPEWQGVEASMGGAALCAQQKARAGLIDRNQHYRHNLVGDRIPTRLGDGTIEVPVTGLVSPFTGQALSSVPIRGTWLSGVPQGTVGTAQGSLIDVDGRRFTYDERGLRPKSNGLR